MRRFFCNYLGVVHTPEFEKLYVLGAIMKTYKNILMGLVLAVSTVNCESGKNNGGFTPVPLPQPCTGDNCITDLDIESTPEKISYFDGGWYGLPNVPNWRLKVDIDRSGNKINAKVQTPSCTVAGTITAKDYVALDTAMLNVATKVDEVSMVDGGDEVITVTEDGVISKLFLKTGDSSYRKPVVKNRADADRIRKQVQAIADFALKSCKNIPDRYKAWYRQNVYSNGTVDQRALIPHPRLTNTIHDIRITHEASGTRIQGYRTITDLIKTCQVQVNAVIASDAAWRAALAKVNIVRSEIICYPTLGQASEEDMHIYYPANPLSLTVYNRNGTSQTGNFGCMYENRVENGYELENLIKKYLDAQTAKCSSNLSELYQ